MDKNQLLYLVFGVVIVVMCGVVHAVNVQSGLFGGIIYIYY